MQRAAKEQSDSGNMLLRALPSPPLRRSKGSPVRLSNPFSTIATRRITTEITTITRIRGLIAVLPKELTLKWPTGSPELLHRLGVLQYLLAAPSLANTEPQYVHKVCSCTIEVTAASQDHQITISQIAELFT